MTEDTEEEEENEDDPRPTLSFRGVYFRSRKGFDDEAVEVVLVSCGAEREEVDEERAVRGVAS